MNKKNQYVHGYSSRESQRLSDQARTLEELLHGDTIFPRGSTVLEAGCGTGAQTIILATHNPDVRITSIDICDESLAEARRRLDDAGIGTVTFQKADLFDLPFADETFDHIFVCFVLEHLADPIKALASLKRVLRKGGTISAIEGDHGSWYCYPESDAAKKAVQCLIEYQAHLGGNALIGRELYPLLHTAGFEDVVVSPRMVYVDSSRPELVEGFSKNTFIAMVEGVKEYALDLHLVNEQTWRKGIADLYRATEDDGVFCYTFFKALGYKLD